MSVRVHELAKKIGIASKELIPELKRRGFDVKTASSSIDTISAEALEVELKEVFAVSGADENGENRDVKKKISESDDDNDPDITDEEIDELENVASLREEIVSGEDHLGPIELNHPNEVVFVKSKDDVEAARAAAEKKEVKAESEKPSSTPSPMNGPKAVSPMKLAPPKPGMKSPTPMSPEKPASGPVSPSSIPPVKRPDIPQVKSVSGVSSPASIPPVKANPVIPSVKSPSAIPSVRPVVVSSKGPVPMQPKGISVPPSKPAEPAEAVDASNPKILQIKPPIVVRDFAPLLGLKPFQLISKLMEMGIFASMNQIIEEDVAVRIAERNGYLLDIKHRGEQQQEPVKQQQQKKKEEKAPEDDLALLEARPPIICILGHVDHGKTTLMDTIRSANVVAGEAGGITQHIGAYHVMHNEHRLTFLDTPGHAAFSKIRERGAAVTDIAILVVAADDGFMPQTDEALKFAQAASVPVVVAINKMDAKGANMDNVKTQMQQRGISPEDWGGETLCVGISALKKTGIKELLDAVLLQAEIMELKAVYKSDAEGVVIESQIEQGRGPTATVIIERGVLKVGASLVCGQYYCRVKAMVDDRGQSLKEATPSMAVRVIGWSGVPESGTIFKQVKNDKEAKRLAEERADEIKKEKDADVDNGLPKTMSSEDFLNFISRTQDKVLKVILKADVNGSLEALSSSLKAIKSDKVKLEIIGEDIGNISQNDITMANTAGVTIVGFNVKQDNGVAGLAKHYGVRMIQHNIIYELINQVRDAMSDLLDPELRESKLGAAQVRAIFPLGKHFVAGCMVTEGVVRRDASARLIRKNEVIHDGRVETLKRFKDDASEVRAGYECGIQLTGTDAYQEGDVIEIYEIIKVRPAL